ncbi:MAG: tRNA lysidine(34) synthetase TilS [Thermomicrobiales bacterium]
MSRRRRDADARVGVHNGFEQRLLARLKERFPSDCHIIVGYSGGADSLALAAALRRVAPLNGTNVELLHVDHGLRETSAKDAERAREIASILGLACRVKRVDEGRIASHVGVGIEEAARRERYRIFAEEVQDRNGAAIALAHHQTDQAETVLLHLLRGSGVHGAGGMAALVDMTVPWWEHADSHSTVTLRVWRPLLQESRVEVRAYAAKLEIEPIEDPSNADATLHRNAIRREVVPVLERVSPGATAALARYARLTAEVDDFLQQSVDAEIDLAPRGGRRLLIDTFKQWHPALVRAVIHRWLSSYRIEPSAERVDAVFGMIVQPRRNRRVEVGRGLCVSVANGLLIVGECPTVPVSEVES